MVSPLMRPIVLFAITFFCLSAFADDDTTAQGGDSTQAQQNSGAAFKATPEFNAGNFFQPIRKTFERDPNWQLTLAPTTMSTSLFLQELRNHSWRAVYHCSGQPIEAVKLKRLPDGFQNPGMEFSFSQDGVMSRKPVRFRDAKPDPENEIQVENFKDSFLAVSLGNGRFGIDYKGLGPHGHQTFTVLRVREKDEIVLEVVDDNAKPGDLQKLKVCPTGELAKELYISSADFKN